MRVSDVGRLCEFLPVAEKLSFVLPGKDFDSVVSPCENSATFPQIEFEATKCTISVTVFVSFRLKSHLRRRFANA